MAKRKHQHTLSDYRDGQQQHAPKATDDASASHPKDYPLAPLTGEIKNLIETYKAEQAASGIQHTKQLAVQRFIAVFTFLAFLAAAIYAAISYRQWEDLRSNFAADQRAWLKAYQTFPATVGNFPSFSMANLGKSAVLRGDGDIELEIVSNNDTPDFVLHGDILHHLQFSYIFPNEPGGPSVVQPVEDGKYRGFSETEKSALALGTSYMVVYGQLTYKDQFGKHWTRLCGWHSFATGILAPNGARACVDWGTLGDGDPPPK